MPIYEYRCLDCGAVTERFTASIRDAEPPACQGCGGRNLTRMISAPAAVTVGQSKTGTTCCGRDQRCESPPCSTGGGCRRG